MGSDHYQWERDVDKYYFKKIAFVEQPKKILVPPLWENRVFCFLFSSFFPPMTAGGAILFGLVAVCQHADQNQVG